MEALACVAVIASLAVLVVGIVGLGFWVIQPLGAISRVKVTTPRFQLLDLFWLLLLLQPSLLLFGAIFRGMRTQHPVWIAIFVLIGSGTIVAWYIVTGALSKADVTSPGKRATAVLVILPIVGAIIPLVVCAHVASVFYVVAQGLSVSLILSAVLGDIVFLAALFGCRKLSRWIASGIDLSPDTDPRFSASSKISHGE